MKSGIYKIFNVINNKIYIGSSINVTRRIKQHIKKLETNNHINSYLQNSWNKHGKENFIFELLETCNEEKLLEREQFYMDFHKCYNRKSGYNINIRADRKVMSEETKRKISESQKGKTLSSEHKQKIGKSNKGKKQSPQTKKKRSLSMLGKKASDETRNKISIGNKGKHVSDETRKKLSIINKGRFVGCKHTKAKKYIVYFPNGKKKIVVGIANFCRKNNLTSQSMISVELGKRNHHKGFRCEYFK